MFIFLILMAGLLQSKNGRKIEKLAKYDRIRVPSICVTRLNSQANNPENATDHNKQSESNADSASSSSSSSSVDEKEMEHFRRLATEWWNEDGEYVGLHRMNALRVPLIKDTLINYRNTCLNEQNSKTDESSGFNKQDLIREPLLGLNLLDIGCGGGILSEPLARLGANVTAIDSLRENIITAQVRQESELERTKGHAKFLERLRYINCTLEDLAAVEDNSGYFDAVVMSEVVEHVNNLPEFLTNSTKLLKNKGFLFLTTINRTIPSYLLAVIAAEYVFNLVPRGTHSWDKFVTPAEVKDTLEKNETFIKFQMGMHFNPLTKRWSWSKDDLVNYAIYAQKSKTTI